MKVLLTGTTSNQCRPTRTTNTFYSGTLALHSVLNNEHRISYSFGNPDEFDFTDFDAVFVGIYSANALGSAARLPHITQQLLHVDQKKTKIFLHLDDWHASSIKNGLNAMQKEKNARRLMKMFHPKATDSGFEQMIISINTWCGKVRSGEQAYKVLLPMLPWRFDKVNIVGNTMGLTNSEFIPYDYCSAFDPIDLPRPNKERGWVLATKYDYSKYVEEKNFSWPVIRYGCKKNGDNYLPNEEDVVREAYTKYWGLISHPYHNALRGQGRDKFMLATWTNSIILSEPGEFDGTFYYAIRHEEIEQMSDDELQNLARDQRKEYQMRSWTKSDLHAFVLSLLEE